MREKQIHHITVTIRWWGYNAKLKKMKHSTSLFFLIASLCLGYCFTCVDKSQISFTPIIHSNLDILNLKEIKKKVRYIGNSIHKICYKKYFNGIIQLFNIHNNSFCVGSIYAGSTVARNLHKAAIFVTMLSYPAVIWSAPNQVWRDHTPYNVGVGSFSLTLSRWGRFALALFVTFSHRWFVVGCPWS